MSSVSKTYTFTGGTYAKAAEVNQNFDDVVNYTNNEVIVRDGSKAFTAVPSGPAVDPTSNDQFTRKKYVDDKDAALQTSITNLTTTVTTNKTAQDTGLAARATVSGVGNPIIKVGDAVVTTNASGDGYVAYSGGSFPSAVSTVVATAGDASNGVFTSIVGKSKDGFTVRVWNSIVTTGAFDGNLYVARWASSPARVSYIAVGY